MENMFARGKLCHVRLENIGQLEEMQEIVDSEDGRDTGIDVDCSGMEVSDLRFQ